MRGEKEDFLFWVFPTPHEKGPRCAWLQRISSCCREKRPGPPQPARARPGLDSAGGPTQLQLRLLLPRCSYRRARLPSPLPAAAHVVNDYGLVGDDIIGLHGRGHHRRAWPGRRLAAGNSRPLTLDAALLPRLLSLRPGNHHPNPRNLSCPPSFATQEGRTRGGSSALNQSRRASRSE